MEESIKKKQVEGGDREILYSKAIKAGTTSITAKYGDQEVSCIVRCNWDWTWYNNAAARVEQPHCFLFLFQEALPPKQEGNTPQTGQGDHGINQTAEQRTGAAEQPGHQVKLKNSHQSPVYTTDDGQNQRNGIHRS